MKNKRYNLLTTLIVSALHPNEPFGAGTKWEPTNAIDIREAEELTAAKYAEEWTPRKEDELTLTRLQKEDAAKGSGAAGESTVDDDVADPAAGDGLSDDELSLILDGSVDAVAAELEGLDEDTLRRLYELEAARERPRKGVADAINDAIEALEQE